MLKRISILMLVGFSAFSGGAGHDIDDRDLSFKKLPKHKLMTKDDMIISAALAFCQGAGQASGASLGGPVGSLASTVIDPIVHPRRSFNNLRRHIFMMRNSDALTVDRLVAFQHALSNVINVSLVEPANASNKLLRRALADQASNNGNGEDVAFDEYSYAVKSVLAHLTNFYNDLEAPLKLYNSKLSGADSQGVNNAFFTLGGATAFSGAAYAVDRDIKDVPASLLAGSLIAYFGCSAFNSPYSKQELKQIIFMIEQIRSNLDYMITMINSLNGLSQITDKKDAISMLLKGLLNEVASLIFAIDPSKAFDAKYQGLKIIYDDSKLNIDKGAKKA